MQSRVAAISRGVAAVAALLFAGVPIAIQLGLIDSKIGFPIFLFGGGGLGLVALVLGAIGVLRTRANSGREGRSRALVGSGIAAAILLVLFMARPPAGTPSINDITTSTEDPPQFVTAKTLGPNAGSDMSYPAAFAAQQSEAYEDLAPINLSSAPGATLDRIATLVDELGWELVDRDDASGRIEATETSAIFGFVDDIVVRVREVPRGSLVDVRSKSREGRSDLGVNADRIRRLQAALRR